MKGSKRHRAGAWRLRVFAGFDPVSGKRIDLHATVAGENNRAGAKAADAKLAEMIALVERGDVLERLGQPSGERLTVGALAELWQEANRPRRNERTGEWVEWSPKTAKTTSDNFRAYILPTIGGRRAEGLSGAALDELYRSLEVERGLSAWVVLRCHGQLRAMFAWAVRKKLLSANPAVSADPPKVTRTKLEVPSMAEVRRVIDVAPRAFGTYVHLAATIGGRRGTFVALRWKNVDLVNGRVVLERSIAESADGEVEKGTKADRPYVVSIGASTIAILEAHLDLARRRAEGLGIALGEESFVFSDDGGITHWNLSWPSHGWKRYAEKVGLKNVRLHDLRHTAASQMLMAGIPIPIVAERLGCTEANILRTYRHFVPGSDRQAAELIERLIGGA